MINKNEWLNKKTRWLNNGNNIDDIGKITRILKNLNISKGIIYREDSWRDKRLALRQDSDEYCLFIIKANFYFGWSIYFP